MRYRSFTIRDYRAIAGPLTIKVDSASLLPVIGVNECGKTTLLHAILAFDYHNDRGNHGGRHLRDSQNLYSTSPPPPRITASIAISESEFASCVRQLRSQPEWESGKEVRRYLRRKDRLEGTIEVTRDLSTDKYSISAEYLDHEEFNNDLSRTILKSLPYILYFDDFQDAIEEKVEIKSSSAAASTWLNTFERLFKATDPSFSVYKLRSLELRQRKTVLSRVQKRLNQTLTKEWQNFRLDDSDALEISLDYLLEGDDDDSKREFLSFEIVERDANGDEHFFFIRDRSKGFY